MRLSKLTLVCGVFLVLFFLFVTDTFAATYYVSQTDGNDSYDGLEQTHTTGNTGPFKTMGKLAGFGFAAGDQILLKKGDIWRETWYVNTGGSSGNPITYGSYGTDSNKPRITGTDLVTGWTVQSGNVFKANFTNSIDIYLLLEDSVMATPVGSLAAVNGARKFWFDDNNNVVYYWASDGADPDTHIMEIGARYEVVNSDDREYITFDGLQIDGAGGQYGRGFGLKPTWFTPTNIILQNMRITNNYYTGVWVSYANNFTPISNFKIYNSEIDHNGVFGIRIEGQSASYRITGFRLDGSHVHHNGLDTTNIGQIGVWLNHTSAPIVTGSTLNDNQGFLDWSDNLYTGDTKNALVEKNIFYNGYKTNAHFDVDSNGFIFRYNISYGAGWNGVWVEEHLRANGVSYIYNNVFYDNLHGFVFGPGGTAFVVSGVEVKNNIIAYNSRASDDLNNTNDDNDVDYNLYYTDDSAQGQFRYGGTFVDFATWKTNTGWDSHSYFSEPNFRDRTNYDFHLTSGSYAINKGINVGLTADFENNLVPYQNIPDIGAYEWYPQYEPPLPNIYNPTPVCTFLAPTGTVDLFQIDRNGSKATLYFTPTGDQVDHYNVIFGFKEGDERFGGIDIRAQNQNQGVQSLIIDHLDSTKTYSFKIVAVNGCMPGKWSNWLTAKASGLVLTKFYRYH